MGHPLNNDASEVSLNDSSDDSQSTTNRQVDDMWAGNEWFNSLESIQQQALRDYDYNGHTKLNGEVVSIDDYLTYHGYDVFTLESDSLFGA